MSLSNVLMYEKEKTFWFVKFFIAVRKTQGKNIRVNS